jgi:hypothetical protein
MKRFAMTVSLAACLVFLLGVSAMAANHVTIESKSVPPGATGVFIGVYVSNDVGVTGFGLPVEFRSLSGGAYITNGAAFTRGINSAGRMQNSPLGPGYVGPNGPVPASVTNRIFGTMDPADPACPTENPAGSWNTSVPNANNAAFMTDPDAWLLACVSQGVPADGDDISMDPGQEAVGVDIPSIRILTDVTVNLGQFDIDTTCIRPANHLLYVDENTQPVAPTFTKGVITIEIPPNSCPENLSAANTGGLVGAVVTTQINSTDDEGDARVYFASRGSVDASGQWSDIPTCNDFPSYVVTVEVSDTMHPGPGNCQSVQFTVTPQAAQLQITCGNVTVEWDDADATQDVNSVGGCPPHTYSMNSGVGSIDPQTGVWTYDQGCNDVGSSQVSVRVTDANGAFVDCIFTLNVTNDVPVCANIGQVLAQEGVPVVIDLGTPDNDPLTYTLITGTGWPGENITGDTYTATRPAGDPATYTVTYSVSDGCATVQCTFQLIFVNPCIRIVDSRDTSFYSCWLNGQQATVCVYAEGGSIPGDAGGFDFLICYDQSGLSFLSASGGPEGWEYFTYRTGLFGGNCGGGCPDGYVHLLAIADMNNGNDVDPADFNINGKILACLTFYVTADRNFINSCFHVGFCSYSCGDNSISSKDGNQLWIAADGTNEDPAYVCEGIVKGDTVKPLLHFCGGAICVCEPPDDRGDINLNGIANEIGDAVLYTNYFIYGSSVWYDDDNLEQIQILASDINDDGIVLTVADLIYLIRILTGDVQPFPPGTGNGSPKLAPYANSVDVVSDVANGAVTVRTNASVEIGAAMLVFRYSGTVGAPVLANNSGMEIRSNAANGELRVLVSGSVESAAARMGAGANNLVTIPVNGNIELVETQFADYNGALLQVNAASAALPTEYALLQNYPNPFNAGTVIPVSLKEKSDYTLTVYNVAGQVVRTFTGNGIGTINVTWDGRTTDGASVASGMYFYRLTTPKYSATKKMVVLK